jgi:N-acetylmuramoyl-L-alanine amidase
LPGARLGDAALPDGVTAGQDDEGVTLRFESARQYRLRAAPGGLDLVLHAPGLAGKVILLDSGHGGRETGAISPYTGMAEKTVNLDVALRLRDLLEAKGASVVLTRTDDTTVVSDSAGRRSPGGEPGTGGPARAGAHGRGGGRRPAAVDSP